jgi:hypothetical protein
MAIEVFNRYEKKYMLNGRQYHDIVEAMSSHMVLDKYNENKEFYQISNIYYDTWDDTLIRTSIDKPAYKEKLRMRAYGVPELSDKVFVEIKKKYNGIVNKRRTSMRLEDAYMYLGGETSIDSIMEDYVDINGQVLKEIDYFKRVYSLVPKVYLSYDRRAYFEKDDGDFRVTFDTNITTRRENVRLELGSYGSQLLPPDTYLMEIKISGAVPMWFTKIISEFNIYPTSFSKYGTEYTKFIKSAFNKNIVETRKEKEVCLNQYLQPQRQIMPSA